MSSFFAFFVVVISTLWTWTLLGAATFVGYRVSQEHDLTALPGFDALPAFLRIPLQHQTESTIFFTLAGVVSGFLVFFLASYVWQAIQDFLRLAMVSRSLHISCKKGRFAMVADGINPAPSTWGWFYYPLLTRLWREYATTLHHQTMPTTTDHPIQYRATVPAEAIFSLQALVDVPMRVEFFRHLPGILTGAGIVSTFAGILLGLSEFNPAVEAQQITYQLKNLFTGITTAFVASFFAILAAILVTTVEKFLLHWRYAQVTTLQHRIDDLFRAGVEPDYLANLVDNGKLGFQQLQAVLERLVTSMALQPLHPSLTPTVGSLLPKESHFAQFVDPPTQSLPSNQQRELVGQNLTWAVKEALGKPFVEISQLLSRTVETQEWRREGGRSLEIQLISMGERMDVALGEFAHSITTIRQELDSTNETISTILTRQLEIMAQNTTQLATINSQLQAMNEHHKGNTNLATLLRTTLDTQTTAIHSWNDSLLALSHKLPSEEQIHQRIKDTMKVQGTAFQQWTRSLDGLFQKLPSREEFIRLVQTERQHQTEALNGLQQTLETAIGQWPKREELLLWGRDVRDSLEVLVQKANKDSVWAELLQELRSGQTTAFHELKTVMEQLPERLITWLDNQQQGVRNGLLDGFAHQLQETSEHMSQQFAHLETRIQQDRAGVAATLQELMADLATANQNHTTQVQQLHEQNKNTEAVDHATQTLQAAMQTTSAEVITKIAAQVHAARDADKHELDHTLATMMARMETELQQVHDQFQENSRILAGRLASQDQELAIYREMTAGLQLQGLADQLAAELKTTLQQLTEKQKEQIHEQNRLLEQRLQHDSNRLTGHVQASLQEGLLDSTQKLHEQMLAMEKLQVQSSQEVAEQVSNLIFTRLEQTFGTLTAGLAELRERFATERSTIVATMESWRRDSSRSGQEQAQQLEQRIATVIGQVDAHHQKLLGVIDSLNHSLSHDLDGMRDQLLHRTEESTQQVADKVSNLGQVLEGVVNSVGQEQTVFIEMLGERMEALRRRLRVK